MQPVSGGTLVYASGDAEPACLDPHVGGNYPQALVASQYLESLFTKDEDGKIIPWLAESTEVSEDGLARTITLREGISFTDGTKLTAEAIKANIETCRTRTPLPPPATWPWARSLTSRSSTS